MNVRRFEISGSPGVSDMRIYFRIKWPISVVNKDIEGIRIRIEKEKLLKILPFF